MALLRILFASLRSALIKLAVLLGILALLYLLLIKPVLKRTDNAIKTGDQTLQRSLGGVGLGGIEKTFESLSSGVQRQVEQALNAPEHGKDAKHRLLECVQRAEGNAGEIRRCTQRL